MDNAIQLTAIQHLRNEVKSMEVGERKTFVCPSNFSNEAVVAILSKLVEERGIAYGVMPGQSPNQFVVYTTSDVINIRLLGN